MSPPVRPQVLEAIAAGRILSAIGIAICLSILLPEIYSFIESKGKLSLTHAKSRAQIWLLAISLWGLWVLLNCLTMWWVDWRGNEVGCQIVTVPMSPIVYISMKQCLYLFLYDRAKVVHSALNLNGKWMRLWRWVVWLSCTVGVPILTWWLFFIFWRSKVLPEGICVQYFLSTAGVAAVAAADFILSGSLLILFIVPLMKHMQRQQQHVVTKGFEKLMLRNLTVSILMMCSTLTTLLAMCVELTTVFGENPDPSLEHIQIWSTFFPLLDTVMTIILPHFLSTAWIPAKARKYITRPTSVVSTHGLSPKFSRQVADSKSHVSAKFRSTDTTPAEANSTGGADNARLSVQLVNPTESENY
jgi:hypothetical protein